MELVARPRCTAARVSSESSPRPESARDAVDAETPATSATSASVTSRPVLKRLRKRLRRCHSRLRRVKGTRRSLRLGVAGLGGMGVVHARNAARTAGAQLVAVASTRAEQAGAVAAELGVRAIGYGELFAADDVDAVVLAARSIDHAEHACAVLAAGKHLFLEKPGATTMAGQDAVRAASAAHPGQLVHVAYHRRYDARWAEVRTADRGGRDRPSAASSSRPAATCGRPSPRTRCRPAASSSTWPRTSTTPRAGSSARSRSRSTRRGRRSSTRSSRRSAISTTPPSRCASTAAASRSCTSRAPARGATTCASRSPATRARSSSARGVSRDGVSATTAAERASFPQDYRELFTDAYAAELAAFVAACNGDGPPGPGLEDDRRVVAVGVAARASAVAGRPLEVGPDWPWNAVASYDARSSTREVRVPRSRARSRRPRAARRRGPARRPPSRRSRRARPARRRSRRPPRRTGRRAPAPTPCSTVSSCERTRASTAGSTSFRCRCAIRPRAARASSAGSPPPTTAWPVSRQSFTTSGSVASSSAATSSALSIVGRRCAGGTSRARRGRARAARRARRAPPPGAVVARESAVSRRASGRPATASRISFSSAGDHDRPARAGPGEDLDGRVEEREVVAEAVLVGDPQRRERPGQLQAVRLEGARDRLGLVAEVARAARARSRRSRARARPRASGRAGSGRRGRPSAPRLPTCTVPRPGA